MTGVYKGVLELEHYGKVGVLMGTPTTHPGPCQRASSMLSFRNTLSFAVPYATAGCFHLLTRGHLQEVGKMCAKHAIENLLRLGHHPRNPILVAQQGSF